MVTKRCTLSHTTDCKVSCVRGYRRPNYRTGTLAEARPLSVDPQTEGVKSYWCVLRCLDYCQEMKATSLTVPQYSIVMRDGRFLLSTLCPLRLTDGQTDLDCAGQNSDHLRLLRFAVIRFVGRITRCSSKFRHGCRCLCHDMQRRARASCFVASSERNLRTQQGRDKTISTLIPTMTISFLFCF